MAAATRHILTAVIVALCLSIVHGQTPDRLCIRTEKTSGKAIVQEVCRQVEKVLGTTDKLLERTAWVESKYGTDRGTYRPGYHGGIWQVDQSGFRDTQNVKSHPRLVTAYKKIQNHFGIDWTKVKYEDLRKPLYSGIAARLYYRNKSAPIPTNLLDQAKYWKKNYNSGHGKGSVNKFVKDVNALSTGDPVREILKAFSSSFFTGGPSTTFQQCSVSVPSQSFSSFPTLLQQNHRLSATPWFTTSAYKDATPPRVTATATEGNFKSVTKPATRAHVTTSFPGPSAAEAPDQ